jgi:nicotinate-nucleotide adenylyltransferase
VAVESQPGFVADDRELRREGDSYSVDTLASLRQEFPDRPLCLLLGMDAFNGFARWRRPLEILRLAHLIVMHRPGEPGPTDPAAQQIFTDHACTEARALSERPAGGIWLQGVTQLDISSTRIRALVAAGQSPRFLLPDAVGQVVTEQRLYRGENFFP